jgi:hypothetical protein
MIYRHSPNPMHAMLVHALVLISRELVIRYEFKSWVLRKVTV